LNALLVSENRETLGKEYPLGTEPRTLGRKEDNNVVLDSPRVSRHHARITWDGIRYVVEDLGSKNGTYVNGVPVHEPCPIADGDSLLLGDQMFTFQFLVDRMATVSLARRTRETTTVLFTDLQGFTALQEEVGDETAQRIVQEHFDLIRRELTVYGGREIKTMGDGVMASFVSVRDAVECAIALQRANASHEGVDRKRRLRVRVGINSGEMLKEESDLFGVAVTKAYRIAAEAEGDQILLSEVSRRLLGPASGIQVVSRGWYRLKGLKGKEHLYSVEWA
jgi:class 3 adenylate cyclase